MREEASTNVSADRSVSQIKNHWTAELKNLFMRFELDQSELKVQVLSVLDFKYYAGSFIIQQEEERPKDDKKVPRCIVQGIEYKYNELQFKLGRLYFTFGFQGLKQKYCFPPLQRIHIDEQLFKIISEVKQKDFALRSAQKKIQTLENEKRSMLKELKETHGHLTAMRREAQEELTSKAKRWFGQKWKQTALKRTVKKALTEMSKNPQRTMTFVYVSILVAILVMASVHD